MALTQIPIELSSTPGIVDNSDATAITIDSSENVGIGTSSPDTLLELVGADPILTIRDSSTSSGTANATLRLAESGASDTLDAYWDIKAVGGQLQFIDNWNEGGGTGTRVVIDDSGNLLVGTDSGDSFNTHSKLRMQNNDHAYLQIKANSAKQAGVLLGDTDDDFVGGMIYDNSDNSLRFNSGDSEAMRIDSSGNLLVGTTNALPDTGNVEGIALSSGSYGGRLGLTRDGGAALNVNRKTSNGTIAFFYKDGTAVGSIGTTSAGNFAFFTPSEGGIETAAVGILPMNDGVRSDNETDLGFSGARFKDLYLSGGVYLGGTGSANKLDDYEEGTWTPTSGVTLTVNYANYTKVGRLVFLNLDIAVGTTTSGSSFVITGVPFATVDAYSTGSFNYQTTTFDNATVDLESTGIHIRSEPDTGIMTYAQLSGRRLIFNVIYRTTS